MKQSEGQEVVQRFLYMYGAVTQIELNSFLEVNTIESVERQKQIKADWLGAAEHFQALVGSEAGMPDKVTTKPIGGEAEELVEELKRNPAFTKTFANFPITVEQVEIDKVVASQRTVHLDFVERIKKRFLEEKPDIYLFCLHPGQDTTPVRIGRTAQNAFTLSSENPSLRFLGVFEQTCGTEMLGDNHPGGQPVHSVVVILGYGVSTINVYRVGKRIILNNGFHPFFALRSLGIEYVPVVVQEVTHPELEVGNQIADLPRDYLVETPRPGLMKDFFDGRLTCEVRRQNFIQSVQVGWGIQPSKVPR